MEFSRKWQKCTKGCRGGAFSVSIAVANLFFLPENVVANDMHSNM